MAAGRPRDATEMKKLKGTHRPSRDDSGLKTPYEEAVDLVEFGELSELETEFLGSILGFLKEFQVTHHLDKSALLMMADMYKTYQQEKRMLELEGRVIEHVSNRGEVHMKENPRVKIMFSAFDRLFKLMNEFGLTPNARARMTVVKSEESDMKKLLENR